MSLQKPQVILFDFDGTLADSLATIVDCYNEVALRFNARKVQKEEFAGLMSKKPEEIFKKLNVGLFKLYFIASEIRKQMKHRVKETLPFQDIKKLLAALKDAGCILGILSSNSVKNIKQFLVHHNLHFFDYIYCAKNLFGKDKVLKKFMRKLKLREDDVLYVGDELRDIEACRKTGVPIISVTWGYNSRDILAPANPLFLADKAMDILNFLSIGHN